MATVFVSYRRDDAGPEAGRLYDGLVERFGRANVFRDQDSTPHGADFAEIIRARVVRCDALIAVIGPDWLGGGASGRRRTDDPSDWVRVEIATALARGVLVIPVLIKGARLPAAADLPADLQPLTRRQAMPFAESTWRTQTEDMLARLGQSIDPPLPWARTPTSIVVSSALSSAVASLPGVAIGGLFPPRSNPWATIFAALVGALSTAALVVVVVAARRSAWPAGVAVGTATVVGGFLNGVLGIVPLTGVDVYVLYAFGFALSAFAAMLPTQSVQHIALGSLLGALGGVIVAAFQGIDGNSVTMLVFAVAIYGALVAMAIAVAPRPTKLLHR